MVKYNIISTGSDGNATILEDFVLVDCGVPYKALEPYVPKLKLVLLTHIHSDHFQKRTIKRLASERPTLRFGCCRWLVPPLIAAGVPERQIDVLTPRTLYGYGLCNEMLIAASGKRGSALLPCVVVDEKGIKRAAVRAKAMARACYPEYEKFNVVKMKVISDE